MAEPMRRCIATGEVKDKSQMLRFVVGPGDSLVVDPKGELPGRGIWLTPTRKAIDAAVKKRLFARSAKGPVRVEEDLSARIEAVLARSCLSLLGLGRRSGQVLNGFEKVRGELSARRVAILIVACDAAEGSREKIRRLAGGVPRVECFTVEELSLALGRENVVHAAFAHGGLARRFLAETERLKGFRSQVEPDMNGVSE